MAFFNNSPCSLVNEYIPAARGYDVDACGLARIIEEAAIDNEAISELMHKHDRLEMMAHYETTVEALEEFNTIKEGVVKDIFMAVINAFKAFFAKVFGYIRSLISKVTGYNQSVEEWFEDAEKWVNAMNGNNVSLESYGDVLTEAISSLKFNGYIEIEGYDFTAHQINHYVNDSGTGQEIEYVKSLVGMVRDEIEFLNRMMRDINDYSIDKAKYPDHKDNEQARTALISHRKKAIEESEESCKKIVEFQKEEFNHTSEEYTKILARMCPYNNTTTIRYDANKLKEHFNIAQNASKVVNSLKKIEAEAKHEYDMGINILNTAKQKFYNISDEFAYIKQMAIRCCNILNRSMQQFVNGKLQFFSSYITLLTRFVNQTKRAFDAMRSKYRMSVRKTD